MARPLKSKLDDLVLKVRHVDLRVVENETEFRESLEALFANLEAVLDFLGGFQPKTQRGRRVADDVKLKAVRLRELCRAVPARFDDPNAWHAAAARIMANYDLFRSDAGHLYELEVPGAGFAVLAAAL